MRPGRYAATDGSFARSAGGAGVRGLALLALALIIGVVLLNATDADPPGTTAKPLPSPPPFDTKGANVVIVLGADAAPRFGTPAAPTTTAAAGATTTTAKAAAGATTTTTAAATTTTKKP